MNVCWYVSYKGRVGYMYQSLQNDAWKCGYILATDTIFCVITSQVKCIEIPSQRKESSWVLFCFVYDKSLPIKQQIYKDDKMAKGCVIS